MIGFADHDTPTLPHFPGTTTYTLRTLNHPYAMPNVRPLDSLSSPFQQAGL